MADAPIRTRPGKAARNERLKARGTTLNAISVAALIATTIQPSVTGAFRPEYAAIGAGVFVVTQVALHYVLGRIED